MTCRMGAGAVARNLRSLEAGCKVKSGRPQRGSRGREQGSSGAGQQGRMGAWRPGNNN